MPWAKSISCRCFWSHFLIFPNIGRRCRVSLMLRRRMPPHHKEMHDRAKEKQGDPSPGTQISCENHYDNQRDRKGAAENHGQGMISKQAFKGNFIHLPFPPFLSGDRHQRHLPKLGSLLSMDEDSSLWSGQGQRCVQPDLKSRLIILSPIRMSSGKHWRSLL